MQTRQVSMQAARCIAILTRAWEIHQACWVRRQAQMLACSHCICLCYVCVRLLRFWCRVQSQGFQQGCPWDCLHPQEAPLSAATSLITWKVLPCSRVCHVKSLVIAVTSHRLAALFRHNHCSSICIMCSRLHSTAVTYIPNCSQDHTSEPVL